MTLKDIKPGAVVEIKKVNGTGSVKTRIMDMGITKGTIIKMKDSAPLGDPLQLMVRGYSLSLRKKDAENIEVCQVSA